MFALSVKNYRCYKSTVFLQLILKLMLFLSLLSFSLKKQASNCYVCALNV